LRKRQSVLVDLVGKQFVFQIHPNDVCQTQQLTIQFSAFRDTSSWQAMRESELPKQSPEEQKNGA